jgi:hypothetical protein
LEKYKCYIKLPALSNNLLLTFAMLLRKILFMKIICCRFQEIAEKFLENLNLQKVTSAIVENTDVIIISISSDEETRNETIITIKKKAEIINSDSEEEITENNKEIKDLNRNEKENKEEIPLKRRKIVDSKYEYI